VVETQLQRNRTYLKFKCNSDNATVLLAPQEALHSAQEPKGGWRLSEHALTPNHGPELELPALQQAHHVTLR